MIGTLAAARRRSTPVPEQLVGVTYSQSSLWVANTAADYTGMNDGSANGGTQTGTDISPTPTYIKADCGSTKAIDHIVIGYDYATSLSGGWGVSWTEGLLVEGSIDNSSWTSITTTPTYASTGSSNGIVSISTAGNYRYIRLRHPTDYYMTTMEFQIWGN